METTPTLPRRRTAKTWARLIKAWKKSGKTADEFAALHGIAPRTLTWWKWRLASRPASPTADPLHFVPLQLEPSSAMARIASPDETPAWELVTARGHVLRVHRAIASAELSAVLTALARVEDRR